MGMQHIGLTQSRAIDMLGAVNESSGPGSLALSLHSESGFKNIVADNLVFNRVKAARAWRSTMIVISEVCGSRQLTAVCRGQVNDYLNANSYALDQG